jgi:hypothetical protein
MGAGAETHPVACEPREPQPHGRGAQVLRLALVAGCIAAAAAADLAASALPQPKAVAVGAALLGGLLVLRRPSSRVEPEPPAAVSAGGRRSRGKGQQWNDALEARLDSVVRQVEDLEKRFVSLSGRQSLIQVSARDGLADADRRISAIEAAVERADERGRQQAKQAQELLAHLVQETREISDSAKRLL